MYASNYQRAMTVSKPMALKALENSFRDLKQAESYLLKNIDQLRAEAIKELATELENLVIEQMIDDQL